MDNNHQITVTSPLLPDLDEFHQLLKEIWDSKWITNNGSFHQRRNPASDYGTSGTANNRRGNNYPLQLRGYDPLIVVERHKTRVCRH